MEILENILVMEFVGKDLQSGENSSLLSYSGPCLGGIYSVLPRHGAAPSSNSEILGVVSTFIFCVQVQLSGL